MNRVCKALEQFWQLWKDRFAAGPSKVALMLVPASLPSSTNLPSLDGAAIGLVSSFSVLGPTFDSNLSFAHLLEVTRARFIQETSQLCVSLRDLGIGLPHHTQQVAIRVESSVLHGTEPLASAAVGWLQVSKRLNAAHYRALKAILGIEGISLGSGGYGSCVL